MATAALSRDIARPVTRKVARLRRWVRAYVLIEGIATTVIVLCLAFWIGLIIDWSLEPSVAVRVALWAVAAGAVGYAFYHMVWRRIVVPLSDASLALLLERRFGDFNESLVTTVESLGRQQDSEFQAALLGRTARQAVERLREAPLRRVFRVRPLLRKLLLAVGLIATIAAWAAFNEQAFGFWLERMQLSQTPWPRRVDLQVAGFEEVDGVLTAKVARDDDFELLATASIVDEHVAPERVEIRYRLADGRRGRDPMTRVGQALPGRDQRQRYRYQFKSVASNLNFDLYGGDDRVENLQLLAVDRPTVSKIEIRSTPPDYLGQAPLLIQSAGRASVPEGSRVVCRVAANKPLVEITVRDAQRQVDLPVERVAAEADRFTVDLGEVRTDRVLLVSLRDVDGIETREPYRVVVAAIPDETPEASVQLRGIGSAITPQAVLPMVGEVTDDYGMERIWYEMSVDQREPVVRPIDRQPRGNRRVTALSPLDLSATDEASNRPLLELAPGQQLALRLRAVDAYNLGDQPHVGSSQRFLLDVVTPSELRGLLERQELALRQRFESIYEKMIGTRKLLDRVGGDVSQQAGDTLEDAERKRLFDRAQARIGGARQTTTQLAFETLGVAGGFDQIVAEMVNNRVATEELKERLQQGISAPLVEIGDELMPPLAEQLTELERQYAENPAEMDELLAAAQSRGDEVIEAMKAVLDRMLELESYNELVELLRNIVDQQEQLNERTKQQQREKLRQLLEE